jgi:hypothetical protein
MSDASVTVFTKVATPGEPTTLSKRISIGDDGRVFSDGSACHMAEGIARTVSAPDAQALAHVIGNLGSENALALDVSAHSECRFVTARALKQMSGRALNSMPVIARTREFINYRHGPAWRQMSELTDQTSRSKVADGYRPNGGSPKDRRETILRLSDGTKLPDRQSSGCCGCDI